MQVSGQIHAPDPLPLGKEPRYPIDRRLGGPQSRESNHGCSACSFKVKSGVYFQGFCKFKMTHPELLMFNCMELDKPITNFMV